MNVGNIKANVLTIQFQDLKRIWKQQQYKNEKQYPLQLAQRKARKLKQT